MAADRDHHAERIARSRQGRGGGAALWWFDGGRERYEREMRLDGLEPAVVADLLQEVDRDLRPQLLDAAIENLRRKVTGS